jgi:hypothetical protein
MKRNLRSLLLRKLWLGLLGAILPLQAASAQEKTTVPPGTPVTITVTQGSPPAPPVSITLDERHGHVTPYKNKCTHTGGGLIDVSSPSADTIVITMSGVALSTSELKYDLDQVFEVSFDDPKVKKAKLTVEGRVIGLLRGEKNGCAEYSDACANIASGTTDIVSLCVAPHSACDCESLGINDHDGPKTLPVTASKYTLHQTFRIAAYGGHWLGKKASAEFAPDPALDPLWISYWEPFHGIKKDTFGFQVTIKVAADTEEAPATNGKDKKPEEVVPPKPAEEKKDNKKAAMYFPLLKPGSVSAAGR